jgi:hypothetical protein
MAQLAPAYGDSSCGGPVPVGGPRVRRTTAASTTSSNSAAQGELAFQIRDLSIAFGMFFAELIIPPLQALDLLRLPRIRMRDALGRSRSSIRQALGPSPTHSPYGTPVTSGCTA